MLGCIRGELFRIARKKLIWIIGCISVGLVSCSFLMAVIKSWGKLDIKQFSCIENWFLNDDVCFMAFQLLIIFFSMPITACTLFYDETKGSIQPSLYCRASYGKYISAKLVTFAILSCLIVFIPIMINGIACILCFPSPMETFYTPSLQPAWNSGLWFGAYPNQILYSHYPILFMLYYAWNCTFVTWWVGCCSLLITMQFPENRLLPIFAPILLIMALGVISSVLAMLIDGFPNISIPYIMSVKHSGSLWSRAVILMLIYSAALILWYKVLVRTNDML